DTVTLAGGVVLKVTTVSAGVVTAAQVTQPYWRAGAPGSWTAVVQQKSSGAGTGATFDLTVLTPTIYGTARLVSTYAGHAFTIARSDTVAGNVKNIDFLGNGDVDWAALDGFVGAAVPMQSYAT